MEKNRSKQLMSRRATLRLLGVAGASAFVGLAGGRVIERLPVGRRGLSSSAGATSCVVRPALTEGPYFVDEKLNRSDIRTDPTTGALRPGVPLILNFNVSAVSGSSCVPLPNAYVDVWHCDALGTYSDVTGARGQKFLRGYQVTDANGAAQFTTIYPGWYSGRAVHIHFKVRMFSGSQKTYEFTSQFFFPDAFNQQVYTQSPYNSKGNPDTPNSRDGIYNGGGAQLLLTPTASGQGYAATLDISLEGVPVVPTTPAAAPQIFNASVSGKQLLVLGENFAAGAVLLMDGVKQKKTVADDANPTSLLIARKSGVQIAAGQSVMLQVRNLDGQTSNEFSYTRSS
ncbi:MAG TPA: intradiol ring-cleavage dioxygenase [Blastocatellia bacterium]|nr:intradiol ring-cleavage dioxygenase [Blastocatellia bacterium]